MNHAVEKASLKYTETKYSNICDKLAMVKGSAWFPHYVQVTVFSSDIPAGSQFISILFYAVNLCIWYSMVENQFSVLQA